MSKKKSEAALKRWAAYTEEERNAISSKIREGHLALWKGYTEEERRERGRLISEGRRKAKYAKND